MVVNRAKDNGKAGDEDISEDRPRFSSSPSDFGVDLSKLTKQSQDAWDNQERFLSAYAGRGTKSSTATRIGISREAVRLWERDNLLEFTKRFADAQEHFNNILEDKALELALGLKPGQNVVALAILMNGNMPEKYVHNVVVVDDTSKQVAAMLAKMAQEDREEREIGQSPLPNPDNVTQLERMRQRQD